MNKKRFQCIGYEKIFFIFSVLFTIILTYFVTKNCIDSDASSELVLAEHLAKSGKLFSTDWIYSTELRVLNTQLIYAPLFLLFNSWHLVRFFGSLLLQLILILSYFTFTHLLNIEQKIFYICSGLFLLPVSVCWGRIVLYHCYYIPHISISLIIVGLTFAKLSKVRLTLLFLLSFVGGLGGVRHLLMTHAPILLTVFIYWCIKDLLNKEGMFFCEKWSLLLAAVFSALMSVAGFVVNKKILINIFTFTDYSKSEIKLLDTEKIKDVLYGYFHHFGFRDEIEIMSLTGVLSVLGIFMGICCFTVSVFKIIKISKENSIAKALPYVFFVAFTTVMMTVFLIMDNGYYFVLYFTPLVIWMIPVFVLQAKEVPEKISIINMKKLLPYIAVIILLFNGLANSVYYVSDTHFQQKYEGLRFQNKNQKSQMMPVVEFLESKNYELGYATFWNSNILTEMTNGNIKMINLWINQSNGKTTLYDWLTLKSNRNLQGKKEFLLLESNLRKTFEANKNLDEYEIVYQDDLFIVYNIPK